MNEINYAEIGARIRDARMRQKLTQEEASERCDITSSYYGNIERGEKKMSLETLVKISRGLGVSSDNLLFGEEVSRQDLLEETLSNVQCRVDKNQFNKYLSVINAIATIVDKL